MKRRIQKSPESSLIALEQMHVLKVVGKSER